MKFGGTKYIILSFYCLVVFIAAILFLHPIKAFAIDNQHLLINEVYSRPITESDQEILTKEWIEIYNPTNEAIDLSNFTLEDNSHKPKDILSLKINPSVSSILPGNYLLVEFPGLNNDGDCVILKNESTIIDSVCYGDYEDEILLNSEEKNAKAPNVGKSITRILGTENTGNNNIDFITADPTPGTFYEKQEEAEEVSDDSAGDSISISGARQKENGEKVTISGKVTVLPGTMSSQYFYIQDATGGIQIYCYDKDFPELIIGDEILITGKLSETNNERRLKIDGAYDIIIQNHTDSISPEEIQISDINETKEGTFVKITGTVAETSGDTFFVTDGEREIKVIIKDSTGIDKPKMGKGDVVEISGIVSQYKDEYRLLPTKQDDVKIITSETEKLPLAGEGELVYFIFSVSVFILWNTLQKAKKRLIKLLPI